MKRIQSQRPEDLAIVLTSLDFLPVHLEPQKDDLLPVSTLFV